VTATGPAPRGALLGSNCGRDPIVRCATLINTESVLNVALLDDHPAVLADLRRLIEPEGEHAVALAFEALDQYSRARPVGLIGLVGATLGLEILLQTPLGFPQPQFA
jgi:hypothetical protein